MRIALFQKLLSFHLDKMLVQKFVPAWWNVAKGDEDVNLLFLFVSETWVVGGRGRFLQYPPTCAWLRVVLVLTKKMTIMVSPTFRCLHLLQRKIVKGSVADLGQLRILLQFLSEESVYAETSEIPLLSSFSSPVRVLRLPRTKYLSPKMWWFFFAQIIIYHVLITGKKKLCGVFWWNVALEWGQKWALKWKNSRKSILVFLFKRLKAWWTDA